MNMGLLRYTTSLVLPVVLLCLSPCHGANILFSSLLGEGSHFLGAANIGESLVARGHRVTFLIGKAFAHRADDEKYAGILNFIIFQQDVPVEDIQSRFNKLNEHAFEGSMANARSTLEVLRDGGGFDCRNLLNDVEVIGKLREEKFDMVVFDVSWPCAPVVSAAKLGHVPLIGLSMTPFPSMIGVFAGIEPSLSYMPVIGVGYTDDMTFFQRVGNVFLYHFLHKVFRRYYFSHIDELIREHAISSPTGNLDGLLYNVSFWLVNADFVVEFPFPIPPNLILVGGLTTRPAQPLSADLEDFVQSSGPEGVLICTFGTYITSLPDRIVQMLINAFSRLPQKIVWQLSSPLSNFSKPLPRNIKTLPWLPQNDLLGHPKTKAFLYQGGNNGLYEALYHGVPIVVLPIHGDQVDVATLVEANGIGIRLDKMTLTSDAIFRVLHEVTTNTTYKENSKARSAIYRDQPLRPADRAAFWVEHVIKHGGGHLRSKALKQGFVENSLLDVYAFILAVTCIFVLILIKTIGCIRRQCSHKKNLKRD